MSEEYFVQSYSDSGIMGKETLSGRNVDGVGNFTVCSKVVSIEYFRWGLGMNGTLLTTNLSSILEASELYL